MLQVSGVEVDQEATRLKLASASNIGVDDIFSYADGDEGMKKHKSRASRAGTTFVRRAEDADEDEDETS